MLFWKNAHDAVEVRDEYRWRVGIRISIRQHIVSNAAADSGGFALPKVQQATAIVVLSLSKGLILSFTCAQEMCQKERGKSSAASDADMELDGDKEGPSTSSPKLRLSKHTSSSDDDQEDPPSPKSRDDSSS